jgi:hypothetical protein
MLKPYPHHVARRRIPELAGKTRYLSEVLLPCVTYGIARHTRSKVEQRLPGMQASRFLGSGKMAKCAALPGQRVHPGAGLDHLLPIIEPQPPDAELDRRSLPNQSHLWATTG